MPDRAQHTKGKHASHNKKAKARRSHPNKSSQQESVSLTPKATAPPEKIATSLTDVVTQPPTAVRCPNLLIELRRVAILAVVILTILLALILVLD